MHASIRLLLAPPGTTGIKASLLSTRKLILPFVWLGALQAAVMCGSLMLFFVGSVLFAVWMMFAPYIVADEDVRGMCAIVKSRELIRGRWWMMLGYLGALGLAGWAAGLIVTGVPQIFGASAGMTSFLNGALSVVTVPFSFCYQVVLYRHAKASRGDIGTFPKPGQMKWYWIVALLGPISAIVGFIAVSGLLSLLGGHGAEIFNAARSINATTITDPSDPRIQLQKQLGL